MSDIYYLPVTLDELEIIIDTYALHNPATRRLALNAVTLRADIDQTRATQEATQEAVRVVEAAKPRRVRVCPHPIFIVDERPLDAGLE